MSDQQQPAYTPDLDDAVRAEREYLRLRRRTYGLPEIPPEGPAPDLWGLSISGGGIRSATLGLGMLQKLITEGLLKRVDYLSTVSGGGYIGACLSSLMNTDPARFVQPPADPGRLPQDPPAPGMDPDTSPLVLLMPRKPEPAPPPQRSRVVPAEALPEQQPELRSRLEAELPDLDLDYLPAPETRLDARHQIHHLRTHGEYLTPHKGLFSPHVMRAAGAVFAGIVHNLLLFFLALTAVVCLHYLVFDWVSEGDFFRKISENSHMEREAGGRIADTEALNQEIGEKLIGLWTLGIRYFLRVIVDTLARYWPVALGLAGLGLLVSLAYLRRAPQLIRKARQYEEKVRKGQKPITSPSGYTPEDVVEYGFARRFTRAFVLAGPLSAVALWLAGKALGWFPASDYWLIFSLPLSYAAGVFLGVYTVVPLLDSAPDQMRFARSLYGSLRGGALYAVLASVLMPIAVLVLFSFSFYFDDLFSSLFSSVSSVISIAVGYLAMTRQDKNSALSAFLGRIRLPVLSLSVLLFIALAFSSIARHLAWQSQLEGRYAHYPLLLLGASAGLFLLLGLFINSNKLSLHYFYRDRLTEAFLRTDGRIRRALSDRQGMPQINLRNDENLRLRDLGWRRLSVEEARLVSAETHPAYRFEADGAVWAPHARGPYHLFVTALNLQGTNELVRKSMKSEHFIFSRDYIGSASTGYVRSDVYRGGTTKLARAMAISGAAVNSGMGFSTFFAQSFITTLLNLRLGYWMENPWFYRNNCNEQPVADPMKRRMMQLQGWQPGRAPEMMRFDPKRPFTFWPYYLLREILGRTAANRRMINLSDGGHTGDNLGLLPLLARRCRMLIVCDFEEDPQFTFASFNHAVRMAYIEEHIAIQIDLKPLAPEKPDPKRMMPSGHPVAMGDIRYPDGSRGKLIYIKSALPASGLPVNVFNYANVHPEFPHQPTADQYFDDAQFEAYRALGFMLGGQAASLIQDYLNTWRPDAP
ncbi:MAG: patatin-like phospholipase family protein [Bacteroidia bacterium]|nr:patatin-like phospholipase family protein [Bacteroidia bacterium]